MAARKPPRSPKEKEQRRVLSLLKRELALQVYDKKGIDPASIANELRYQGRARGFLVIPNELIFSGNHLSLGEKVTWIAIFLHNWNPDPLYRVSWPGRERLALIIGKSVRQVSTYLAGLRRKNLLLTKRRLDRPSLYLLMDPPLRWMNETKRELAVLRSNKKHGRQREIQGDTEQFVAQAEQEESCINDEEERCP